MHNLSQAKAVADKLAALDVTKQVAEIHESVRNDTEDRYVTDTLDKFFKFHRDNEKALQALDTEAFAKAHVRKPGESVGAFVYKDAQRYFLIWYGAGPVELT